MNDSNLTVEESLRRTGARWRWLRFFEHTATLGALVSVALLLVGLAAHFGVIVRPGVFQTWLFLVVALALVAWACVALNVVFGEVERGWLAGQMERSSPHLQDRVNTLVFLEKDRAKPTVRSFYHRITQQAHLALAREAATAQFSRTRALVRLGVFAVVLVATVCFFQIYNPYARLLAAQAAKKAPKAESVVQLPEELMKPEMNIAEAKEKWGEVRITDPARDLQVTKVDVVPLQIEAAANEALKKVGWHTAVNGAAETPHELPAPPEPRYAVYQPTVYLDEFRLSDWDVMTYYAKANTENSNTHASQIYFLEVRPFREDILKMPGGEGGAAYSMLNELTSLISQQQHVIRQTHQHIQQPPAQANLQAQDRGKLADAESDLSSAAKHLYSRMATEMENKPIGPALDQLAKAEKSLGAAADALRKDDMKEAPNRERNGLADLVAARKIFQKAVSENPKDFEEGKPEEQTPIAQKKDALKEISEFRNEQKAAQDFMQQTISNQLAIARQARSTSRTNYSKLQQQEQALQKSLENFQQEHPESFRSLDKQTDEAKEGLKKAGEALADRTKSASIPTRAAAEKLEDLSRAMQEKSGERDLADAYKLKQMLDQQIKTLGQCQSSPSSFSSGDLQKLAEKSGQTLSELKKSVDQQQGSGALGPEAGKELSDAKMQEMKSQLGQLAGSQSDGEKKDAAGKAKGSLSKVSEAFEKSEPKASQTARKSDSLKPSEQGSMERGLAQLGSLVRQLQEGRPMDSKDQGKQGQEALANLQRGMQSLYGNHKPGQEILVEMERELKGQAEKPDPEKLKKLMEKLQNFSVELAEKDKKPDQPEVTNIDPAKLPPAYRGRIEKYFQKLSEK